MNFIYLLQLSSKLRDICEQRRLKERGKDWLALSYTHKEMGVTNTDDIN